MRPLLFALSLGVSAPAYAQTEFHLQGSSAGEFYGQAVACGGDVNGDGQNDWIIGAPANDDVASRAGRVEVRSGADGSLLYELFGAAANDEFGFAVAGAGDVNGDQHDDLLVGAPGDDTVFVDGGRVFVYSGLDGSLLRTFSGEAGDRLGSAIAGAGDVDGDGFADFAIGAPWADGGDFNTGRVRVISGFDWSDLHDIEGDAGGDRLGTSVAGPGDIDGDSVPDILAGAPRADVLGLELGWARVYSGATGAVIYQREGLNHTDRFGEGVAATGDVDGDGRSDFAVSGPGFSGAGRVAVFSGADGALIHELFDAAASFGSWVAGAGDFNGDGRADFLTGEHLDGLAGDGSGRACVWSGATGALLADFHGPSAFDNLGFHGAGVGDLNEDGFDDVIVGAPGESFGGIRTGATWLFRGTPLRLSEPVPGVAGGLNSLELEGGSPGNVVSLYARTKFQMYPVVCAAGTVSIDIKNPKFVANVVVAPDGTAEVVRNVPGRFSGLTFRLQAVEFESCHTSNLVLHPFP